MCLPDNEGFVQFLPPSILPRRSKDRGPTAHPKQKEFTMPATGKISQVIGSTFDVEFPESQLPEIYNAVVVDSKTDANIQGAEGTAGADSTSHHIHVTGEVQQHLGGGRVRAVALGSTDGLRRGMDCVDTGSSLTVPVGKETLGPTMYCSELPL